jgi:hypothetical protein
MKAVVLFTCLSVLATTHPALADTFDVSQPGVIAQPDQLLPTTKPLFSASSQPADRNHISLEDKHDRTINRLWLGAIAAVVAANAFDAGSSWGKRDGNSFLASPDGTFGAKGASIKAGMTAGIIIPQILLLRGKSDLKKRVAIVGYAEAAFIAAVSVHNLGVAPPAKQ